MEAGSSSATATSSGCRRTSATSTPSSSRTRSFRICRSPRTSRSVSSVSASRRARSRVASRTCCGSSTWAGVGHRKARQLSGGQQQRVALARALVCRPRVSAAGRAARCARSQASEADAALPQADPARARHHVHPRDARPGGGHDDGRHDRGHEPAAGSSSWEPPQELYERPQTAFVAGFLGVSNLLVRQLSRARMPCASTTVRSSRAETTAQPAASAAGVRPEKITLGDGGGSNRLPGTVAETAYIGVATQFVVIRPRAPIQVFAQNIDSGSACAGRWIAGHAQLEPRVHIRRRVQLRRRRRRQ